MGRRDRVAELDRVADQVLEQRDQQRAFALHHGHGADLDGRIGRFDRLGHVGHRSGDDVVEQHLGGRHARAPDARQGQQVVDEFLHPRRTVDGEVDVAVSALVQLAAVPLLQHLAERRDLAEWLLQIVRGHVGELLQFTVGGGQLVPTLVDLAKLSDDLAAHGVDRIAQFDELARATNFDGAVEVAVGHQLGLVDRRCERPQHRTPEFDGDAGEHHHEHHEHADQPSSQPVGGAVQVTAGSRPTPFHDLVESAVARPHLVEQRLAQGQLILGDLTWFHGRQGFGGLHPPRGTRGDEVGDRGGGRPIIPQQVGEFGGDRPFPVLTECVRLEERPLPGQHVSRGCRSPGRPRRPATRRRPPSAGSYRSARRCRAVLRLLNEISAPAAITATTTPARTISTVTRLRSDPREPSMPVTTTRTACGPTVRPVIAAGRNTRAGTSRHRRAVRRRAHARRGRAPRSAPR